MTEYSQKIRINRVAEPKIRIKVKPRVPPLEIELQNTGTEIQWRLGKTGTWETLVLVSAITGPQGDPGTDGADGEDGLMASVVAGLGVSVDSTDPANPIVTAAVQSVAGLTGAILAAALKAALAIAVADITDASANGRSLISAANYAAMKALLAIAQADVAGLTTASSPQFTGIELGHATDTTLTRSAAGVVAVEGVPLYSNIPQNSQSAAYTLVLSDAQKHIFHPAADTTARIWTIPANSSVAYPVGTAITFVNENSAGVITIAITTDTMRLAGAGTTGSRTLAANGIATAIKVTSTSWIISGTGLT